MKTTSLRARTLACALLATTAFCGLTAQPAAAQSAQPAYRALDSNGVDLTHGDFVMSLVEGSIGSGEGELALVRDGVWLSGYNGHVWDSVMLVEHSSSRSVSFGRRAEYFTGTNSLQGNGSTLTLSGGAWEHRSADGTRTVFTPLKPDCTPTGTSSCRWVPASITTPDGRETVLGWEPWTICPDGGVGDQNPCTVADVRLTGISNNRGYSIVFTHAEQNTGGPSGPPLDWFRRTRADFYNQAVGTDSKAHVTYEYPSVGIIEVIDTGGRKWRIAGSSQIVTAIRRPGASADTTTIAYHQGQVTSVVKDGVTTDYQRSVSGGVATMKVTQADGNPATADPETTIVSDLSKGRPTSIKDPTDRTTSYDYDGSGRLTRATAPEGNYVQYTYDARGNVTRTEAFPKGGSGATIVTTALYDQDCSQPLVCNQPRSTTDERGNTTAYDYHDEHGGVKSVTGPPDSGGVRPQTRYAYTLFNETEYRLTGTSTCKTGQAELNGIPAACPGTADEVKTTIGYDVNGNVASTTTGSGDGDPTQTATTAMTWRPMGDLAVVDGPLSDVDDRSYLHYNAARQLVGTISADPDGAGPLKPRAVRNIYAESTDPAAGLPVRVEQGNVANLATDLTTFSAEQAIETAYDSNGRPVAGKVVGGSTVYALTQTFYDALGRPVCTAQRMNMGDFGSSLPDACTLTSTAGGRTPDRIVKTLYDKAGRISQVRSGVGVTGVEAAETTFGYRPNGQVELVVDGRGNKTQYVYDGHDRLEKTIFPSTTGPSNFIDSDPATVLDTAGAVDPGDFEQSVYETLSGGTRTSGNVASFINRAGETIVFTYDALGRTIHKNLPGSELDVAYGYDLLGQLTSASHSAQTLVFTYDALGRQLSQADGSRTYSSRYDPAGRRTRLTHPDGFFVQQDYLVTGEMTRIREREGLTDNPVTSGVGVLATYGYDDLGRRTSLTFGNGEKTLYSYDAVSRLQSLTHDLGGLDTTNDNTIAFTYNSASQIVKRVATNSAYAWTNHFNASAGASFDGLNRPVGDAHDARSNRATDGTRTYAYDSENKGRGVPAAPWHYDPLGRLSGASTSPGAPPAIAYESYVDNLAAERVPGSSTVSRRHVFGPGVDEPIVWYEGPSRRFLHADERGSIVAVTSDAGALLAINRYDEYGQTESTSNAHTGRFLYTGQRYFGGFGLYHYKNRMYDPKVGRFMQPDPIGYEAGMNLYAYVGGDPVNRSDPSGDRGLTNGERNMLQGKFGNLIKPVPLYQIPLPWSTTYPWEIDISSSRWSSDYSKASPVQKELFWHEFYHLFEIQNGIHSWISMATDKVIHGQQESSYAWIAGKSFVNQHYEARAEYFGRCASGRGPCSALSGVVFQPDASTRIAYRDGAFVVTQQVPGSRIPRQTTVPAQGSGPGASGGGGGGSGGKTKVKKVKKPT